MSSPNVCRSQLRRRLSPCTLLPLLVLLLLPLGAQRAEAADYCRFYSNSSYDGSVATYTLPDERFGKPYGAVSLRRTGAQLKDGPPAVYRNAESVRIRASESDIVLYVFEGDDFDGKFQAVRCGRGKTCRWRYGSMRNRIRSFICQRDDFVSTASLDELLENQLLPSYLLADPITAEIHDGVRTQRRRFLRDRIDLKHGRLFWSSSHDLCRTVRCVDGGEGEWRRKYRDYLRYSYEASGRLRLDGIRYTIRIDLWIEPVLVDGRLEFHERHWRVKVTGGAYAYRIRREIGKQVKARFPGLGADITSSLRRALRDVAGAEATHRLFSNNRRLVFSHPCNYYVQRVGYPGHTYSSFEVHNFCGGQTPAYAAAPGLRLLKR